MKLVYLSFFGKEINVELKAEVMVMLYDIGMDHWAGYWLIPYWVIR